MTYWITKFQTYWQKELLVLYFRTRYVILKGYLISAARFLLKYSFIYEIILSDDILHDSKTWWTHLTSLNRFIFSFSRSTLNCFHRAATSATTDGFYTKPEADFEFQFCRLRIMSYGVKTQAILSSTLDFFPNISLAVEYCLIDISLMMFRVSSYFRCAFKISTFP